MSYILDALKKSQLEQEGGDVAGINPYLSSRRRIPQWLVVVLVLAVAGNIGLLAWIYLSPGNGAADLPQAAGAETPANVIAHAPPAQPATEPPAARSERPGPLPPAAVAQPAPAAAAAAAPVSPAPARADPPVPAASAPPPAPPAPAPRQSSAPEPALVQLRDLSETEQTVYNGFTYTSHIFTDEPSECAIVIDGQRLKAGDAFKGLKVIRITEAGVIFAENRRGNLRHVEVSVVEQWDRAG